MDKRLLFFGVVVTAVVIGVLSTITVDDDETSWSLPDSFSLSVAPNKGIECGFYMTVQEQYEDGTRRDVGKKSLLFNPNIFFDLGSTKTSKDVERVINTSFLICDPVVNVGTIEITGGTVVYKVTATDENGNEVLIQQDTKSIFPRTMTSSGMTLPRSTVLANTIESKINNDSESGFTWYKVSAVFNVKIKTNATGDQLQIGSGSVTNAHLLRVLNEAPTIDNGQTAPLGTYVRLTSIKPIELIIDDGHVNSIRVNGEMDDWKSSEGLPTITILKPSTTRFGNDVFQSGIKMSHAGTSGTISKFTVGGIYLGENPPTGTWQVQMHSSGDIRKNPSTGKPLIGMMEFVVLEKEIQNKCDDIISTGTCCQDLNQDGVCDGDEGGNDEVIDANSFFLYSVVFDGDSIDGVVDNVRKLPVSFTPANLFGQTGKGELKYIATRATPMLEFNNPTDNVKIDNPSFTFDVKLTSNGKTVEFTKRIGTTSDFKESDPVKITPVNRFNGKYYTIAEINFNAVDIKNSVERQIGLVDGQEILVTMKGSGNFIATVNGKSYNGVMANMNLEQTFTYKPDFDDEPCKGLSGEELISCRGNDPPNGSGGTCEGLTSQECLNQGGGGISNSELVDIFKRLFEDFKPNNDNSGLTGNGGVDGNGGISGACKLSSGVSCIEAVKSATAFSVNTFITLLPYILGFFALVIIVILIKKAVSK